MFKPRWSLPVLIATAGLVVGLVGAGVGAAALPVVKTAPIYRADAHTCADGAIAGVDQVGVFQVSRSANTVSGLVRMTGGVPNATLRVTIVENHPCVTHYVGTFHTDDDGEGAVNYKTTIDPHAKVVWVLVTRNTHAFASTAIVIG